MSPQKHTMTVLAQITSWIPDRIVENLAKKHKIAARSFSADSHVVTLVYAHLAHSLSLNDICDSLSNHAGSLSQIRNCTPPSRNGLAHANRTRPAAMAEELFWKTHETLARNYPEFMNSSRSYPGLPHRFRNRTIKAVDSTTIQLTADCIGWARHRAQKAAAKMHTVLDMRSFMPSVAIVKSARDSDPKTAWELCAGLRAGEVVVFDRAYVDFRHLHALSGRGVVWVTRLKENILFESAGRQPAGGKAAGDAGQQPAGGKGAADGAAGPTGPAAQAGKAAGDVGQQPAGGKGAAAQAGKAAGDAGQQPAGGKGAAAAQAGKAAGDVGQQPAGKRKYTRKDCTVLSDERIRLTGKGTSELYPEEIRLVRAKIDVRGNETEMAFITNSLDWAPYTVCQLYRSRWSVEMFFKEIKQTLQLADFLGYSENAVRWQVWTALLTYLLLRFVAWHHKWRHAFSRLLTLLRAVLWNYFRMDSIIEGCDKAREMKRNTIRGSPENAYQLTLDL